MNAEGTMVTDVKGIEGTVPPRDLSTTRPDPENLAQFADFILGAKHREAFDFEPIVLPPGSPSVAELIINDRGER